MCVIGHVCLYTYPSLHTSPCTNPSRYVMSISGNQCVLALRTGWQPLHPTQKYFVHLLHTFISLLPYMYTYKLEQFLHCYVHVRHFTPRNITELVWKKNPLRSKVYMKLTRSNDDDSRKHPSNLIFHEKWIKLISHLESIAQSAFYSSFFF